MSGWMRTVVSPRMARRYTPAAFGVWFLGSAGLLEAIRQGQTSNVFFDWLWPWVFAFAGISGLTHAFKPTFRTFTVSGALMVAGMLSRGFTVLAAWVDGSTVLATPNALLATSVWVMFGAAIAMIWLLLTWVRE